MLLPILAFSQTLKNSGSSITVVSGTELTVMGNLESTSGSTINNNGEIKVSGDITNNGSTSLYGNVTMNGSTAQSIAGTVPVNFADLSVSNSSTGITLSNNINVSEDLTMTDGDLNLNGNLIDLGTTGTLLSETADKRIYGTTGTIQASRTLSAPSADNVAGLGFQITSASNLGATQIVRGHSPQTGAGNTGIGRYYDISPTNNSGLDASIVFNYFETEIGSQDEASLLLWRSTDSGANWTNEGGTPNASSNNISLTGIDAFSVWTSSDAANLLPVDLLSFEAKTTDNSNIKLNWTTATEINSSHFELQKSKDGISFEKVTTVAAQGNSNTEMSYDFIDRTAYTGTSYYRLKILDRDASFEYSGIRTVFIDSEDKVVLYPNPYQNGSTLYLQGLPPTETVIVSIYDNTGKIVFEQQIEDAVNYEIRLANFPTGSYIYTVNSKNKLLKSGLLMINE